MTKKYRVYATMKEYGYVDIEANSKEEAKELAFEAINNGDFTSNNSECETGEVVEQN